MFLLSPVTCLPFVEQAAIEAEKGEGSMCTELIDYSASPCLMSIFSVCAVFRVAAKGPFHEPLSGPTDYDAAREVVNRIKRRVSQGGPRITSS